MSTAQITLRNAELVTANASQQAFEQRDSLAITAATVETVANATQAEHAAAVLRDVKRFTRLVEESRKLVKAPVLELTKRIDGLAEELTAHLESESVRISKLLGNFTAEQNRLAEKAAREAQEKERRIREEAAAELARAQAMARNDEQAEADTERIEAQTFDRIVEARTSGTLVAAKPAGIATRTVTRYEVEDIHALYRARPEMVRLTENASVINAVLRGSPNLKIPGLRTWTESAAIVR
jgi:hypothetical protein